MDRHISRRAVLTAPGLLPLAAGAAACAAERPVALANTGKKVLVAYFTRSGNTRVIAEQIKRDLDADLFEIKPARPYPEDYEQTVEQARQERDRGVEPPLAARVENLAGYETIFLGYPIWGETAPPIIRSFLKAHDLRGKALRQFITHGGYGLGSSQQVVASHAPDTRLQTPFVLECDQERRTMNLVRAWLAPPAAI